MEKKCYFAHPVNTYGTPIEEAAVAFIQKAHPRTAIENPNQPKHQEGYKEFQARTAIDRDRHKGMSYFYDVVLPECGSCVAMSFLDGRIGLGVAGEAKWFLERRKPVQLMIPQADGTFVIRKLTKVERQQILLADAKPSIVIGHQETRLRTWVIYNQTKRPYEIAHTVELQMPEGFYPPKQ